MRPAATRASGWRRERPGWAGTPWTAAEGPHWGICSARTAGGRGRRQAPLGGRDRGRMSALAWRPSVRVTFLCPHLRIAGGVRAILTYADRLARRGHDDGDV